MDNENKIGRPKQTENNILFRERFIKIVGKDSTQDEIAKKVGTSRQNVGNWLSGKGRPDIYALAKISKAYNVSTDYLLGLTDVMSINADLAGACEYTGLSEEAAKNLFALTDHDKDSHSKIIETKEFKDIAVYLQDLEKLSAIVLKGFGENSNIPKDLCNLNKECNVLKYLADNSFRKIIERFDLRNTCETDIDFALNGRL